MVPGRSLAGRISVRLARAGVRSAEPDNGGSGDCQLLAGDWRLRQDRIDRDFR